MKSTAKFTSDGLRMCSRCERVESETVLFRPKRNQCIDCVNEVRRVGHNRKIVVEQAILEQNGVPVQERYKTEYKKQWYKDNKVRLSAEDRIKYLDSRENRLIQASERYYNPENVVSNLLRNAKRRAKEASIDFDLDKDFIDILYNQQGGKCAVTGIDFIFEKGETFRRPFAPSIDRVDSTIGYIKDNVRLVCTVVNISLNEFGEEVFRKMCEAYLENTLCRQ